MMPFALLEKVQWTCPMTQCALLTQLLSHSLEL